MRNSFSNHEIVTLAVYLLGGEAKVIDTEDVAVKANEIAPGRFTWRKFPEQINIENVRTFLSDAKKVVTCEARRIFHDAFACGIGSGCFDGRETNFSGLCSSCSFKSR